VARGLGRGGRIVARYLVSLSVIAACVISSPSAIADPRKSACASTGHAVSVDRQVRVFWQRRTVGTYPGQRATARVYFGCDLAGGPIRRLRIPGGTAMVSSDYEDLLQPRLQGHYFAIVLGYFDAQNVHLAEWRITRGRGALNTYYTDLGEVFNGEPDDLELTPDGGLAWLTDALYKRDEAGFARMGFPDADTSLCGGDDWCAATVARRGDVLSWREGRVRRYFTLRGAAGRRPATPSASSAEGGVRQAPVAKDDRSFRPR
jgi:hypothetical protein